MCIHPCVPIYLLRLFYRPAQSRLLYFVYFVCYIVICRSYHKKLDQLFERNIKNLNKNMYARTIYFGYSRYVQNPSFIIFFVQKFHHAFLKLFFGINPDFEHNAVTGFQIFSNTLPTFMLCNLAYTLHR